MPFLCSKKGQAGWKMAKKNLLRACLFIRIHYKYHANDPFLGTSMMWRPQGAIFDILFCFSICHKKKSQIWVKAGTALVCTTCKRKLSFALLQLKPFYALLQLFLHTMLKLPTFLWNIPNEIYCTSNCILKILYGLFYFHWQSLY